VMSDDISNDNARVCRIGNDRFQIGF
jgi:hypothetical protein